MSSADDSRGGDCDIPRWLLARNVAQSTQTLKKDGILVRECDSCHHTAWCKKIRGTKFWLCEPCRMKQGIGVLGALFRGPPGFRGK